MKENLIANKTFDFSLTIIELFIQLKKIMNSSFPNS